VNKGSIAKGFNQHHRAGRKLLSYSVVVVCVALQSSVARLPAMRDIIPPTDPNCQRTIVWEMVGRDPDLLHT
jgi:hypothetical protein